MTPNKDREGVEQIAMNIVHQIGDALYDALPPDVAHEHFVSARQRTNDLAIDFAANLISLHEEKVRADLIALVEGMKRDEKYGMDVAAFKGTAAARAHNRSYNTAIDDILAALKDTLSNKEKQL